MNKLMMILLYIFLFIIGIVAFNLILYFQFKRTILFANYNKHKTYNIKVSYKEKYANERKLYILYCAIFIFASIILFPILILNIYVAILYILYVKRNSFIDKGFSWYSNSKQLLFLPIFLMVFWLIYWISFTIPSFMNQLLEAYFNYSTGYINAIILGIYAFIVVGTIGQIISSNFIKYRAEGGLRDSCFTLFEKIDYKYGVGLKYDSFLEYLKDPYILFYLVIYPILLMILLNVYVFIFLENNMIWIQEKRNLINTMSRNENILIILYAAIVIFLLRPIFISKSQKLGEYIYVITILKILKYIVGFSLLFFCPIVWYNNAGFGNLKLDKAYLLVFIFVYSMIYLYYIMFKYLKVKVYTGYTIGEFTRSAFKNRPDKDLEKYKEEKIMRNLVIDNNPVKVFEGFKRKYFYLLHIIILVCSVIYLFKIYFNMI